MISPNSQSSESGWLSTLGILYPLVFLAAQSFISALVIGFTGSFSLIRLRAVPLIAAAAWAGFTVNREHVPAGLIKSIYASHSIIYLLRYINLALVERWNFSSLGPVSSTQALGEKNNVPWKDDQSDTLRERLAFGMRSTLFPRHIGTPHEVKNVPHFSNRDPSYVPSKARFLIVRAAIILPCYLLLDLVQNAPTSGNVHTQLGSRNVSLLMRLGQVTVQELIMRAGCIGVSWIIAHCVLRIISGVLDLSAAGLGFSEVKACRPLFGALAEAYTVRQFWGNFWHQYLRHDFSALSNFAVDRLSFLRKRRLLARYSKIFLAFFISGIIHLSEDLASDMPWHQSGSIQFFCTQAFGILLEDIVQAGYHRACDSQATENSRQLWARLIGYFWLFAFLTWSSPAWFFPKVMLSITTEKTYFLPFSIIGLLRR